MEAGALISELKRRRVIRALVGYGVAAFAVLQIIEPVMHELRWPDEVLSYLVAGLAVGFSVVVRLAWILDLNRGCTERPETMSGTAGGRLAALAAVAAVALVTSCSHRSSEPGSGVSDAGLDGGPVCVPGTGLSQTAVVGPDGGTLSFEAVTLTFPAGALAEDTPITVTSSTDCPADNLDATTPLYRFEPEGMIFPVPVQVQMSWGGDAGPGLLRWTAPRVGWETLAFEGNSNSASGTTTHFSGGFIGWLRGVLGIGVGFSALDPVIDPGQSATLRVDATFTPITPSGGDNETCQIDQGVGQVPLRFARSADSVVHIYVGFAQVAPAATTTYTATCTGGLDGTAQATVTVRPPLAALTAAPSTIAPGGSSTLSWTLPADTPSTRYTFVVVGGGLQVTQGTSTTVQPLDSTTYELDLSARSAAGGVTVTRHAATVTVTCGKLGAPCGKCCTPATCDTTSVCCMPPGESCASTRDCCVDSTCMGGACCAPNGAACGSRVQCCAGLCQNGSCCHTLRDTCGVDADCCDVANVKCGALGCCTRPGHGCAQDRDCCEGSCNTATGNCCSPVGGNCGADADCCEAGSTCANGRCQGPCQMPGEACSSAAACCAGAACVHAPSGTSQTCCLPSGQGNCTKTADCCPTAGGAAVACTPGAFCCNSPQGGCSTTADCCSGESCQGSTCCSNLAETCTGPADCCSGSCGPILFNNPSLKQCCLGGGKGTCSKAADCCIIGGLIGDALQCTGGICCNPQGGFCNADADCCAGNTCQNSSCAPPACLPFAQQCSAGGEACCGPNTCPSDAGYCCLPQGAHGCNGGSDCCLFQTDTALSSTTCDGITANDAGTCCQSTHAQCTDASECCSGPCTKWGGATVGNCCLDYGATCQIDSDCCDFQYGGCAAPLNHTGKLCCRYDGAVCGGGAVPGNEQCCSGLCNNGQCCTTQGGPCDPTGGVPSQCCPGFTCKGTPGSCQ